MLCPASNMHLTGSRSALYNTKHGHVGCLPRPWSTRRCLIDAATGCRHIAAPGRCRCCTTCNSNSSSNNSSSYTVRWLV